MEGLISAVSRVEQINNLIDDFSIMSGFCYPSTITSDAIRYSKVASVERDETGFTICYFSPSFARGLYLIEYGRFEELKATGALTEAEVRQAKYLFKRLTLINNYKDTLNRILQSIVHKQALYLESGNPKSLLPFSQKELARKVQLAPSSVSRAIRYKSIDTPWGQEIALKRFFPKPKDFNLALIRQILETGARPASDEAIRKELSEKFGVAISRRSVANLREELKLPATNRRRQSSLEVDE